MYDIPDGVTLNIGDNCVVKFSDNAGLNVLSGGTLNVGNSVVFTHIADDSIGGDTNADEGRSLPQYDKYTISGSGNIAIAEDCDWRYKSFEYGGTLEADQLWIGNRVYLVTSDIIVPSGMSLNILEGAVIKFAPNKRIVVQTGGKIFVNGSYENRLRLLQSKTIRLAAIPTATQTLLCRQWAIGVAFFWTGEAGNLDTRSSDTGAAYLATGTAQRQMFSCGTAAAVIFTDARFWILKWTVAFPKPDILRIACLSATAVDWFPIRRKQGRQTAYLRRTAAVYSAMAGRARR